jgi:hypothetical protein
MGQHNTMPGSQETHDRRSSIHRILELLLCRAFLVPPDQRVTADRHQHQLRHKNPAEN